MMKIAAPWMERHHLRFLGLPIGAQCPPSKSQSLLAIELGPAEILVEPSTACKDTQSRMSPNEELDFLTNLFP
jgi:hypothetical protein